ncbi:MAG: alpha-glycosidase [Clostridia bacterium]|nr:alpha-glycosidase [Clostridia bacterium]
MSIDWICHDTHDKEYRSPFGAVPCCREVKLCLGVRSKQRIDAVTLHVWKNNNEAEKLEMPFEKEEVAIMYYSTKIMTTIPGLYWYYFTVIIAGKVYYYGNNDERLGGKGIFSECVPAPFQITVYKDFEIPSWYGEGVMYQIFVDRFYNGNDDGKISNPKKNCFLHGRWEDTPTYIKDPETGAIKRWNFYGGNLKGVIKKLPYLSKLGIGTIYLNPIFESPSNHKYDTADYKKIDSMFGSNEIFRELCSKARKLKIRIILDGVFSHTGSDSVYFNKEGNYPGLGAYQSQSSPYYKWYRFSNHPKTYESWWGIDTLPNVNEMEPSYQDFILNDKDSVVRYWMGLGASGWRLDVADELPDDFIKRMRSVMKEKNSESILLGEVWEDASNKVSYGVNREYLWGEELDSVMNYPFRNIVLDFVLGYIDAHQVHKRLMSIYENYPRQNLNNAMNLIGSHDLPRILTILGEAPLAHTLSTGEKEKFKLNARQRRLGLARLKLLALFQMVYPGVPCIYYGDEAGMEGYSDPYNRGTYPWGREEKELVTFYKKIIALRNNFIVLQKGDWISFPTEGDVYSFLRVYKEDVFLAAFNRNKDKEISIDLKLKEDYQGIWKEVFPFEGKIKTEKGKISLALQPLEGKLFTRIQSINDC